MTANTIDVCIVCEDKRLKKWLQFLQSHSSINKIYSIDGVGLNIFEGDDETSISSTGESISVEIAFVHSSERYLWEQCRIQADPNHVFWFSLTGDPQQQDGNNIYRSTDPNSFEIDQQDIEQAVNYAIAGSGLPDMCYRQAIDENFAWEKEFGQEEIWQTWCKNEARLRLLAARRFSTNGQIPIPISTYIGGLKPLVYVLDDYNEFITEKDGIFAVKESQHNNEVLLGFCQNLNRLAIAFDVRLLPLQLATGATYESVAATLKGQPSDRDRLAAYIVDIDWHSPFSGTTESEELEESNAQLKFMGNRAVHLLSQKYPEIPVFLFTGIRDLKFLSEGLAYGAMWCFHKQLTHHSKPKSKPDEVLEDLDLNYITLEHRLTTAAQNRYSAFTEIPFPEQLVLDPRLRIVQELSKKLKLDDDRKSALKKMVAKLFPTGEAIEPLKILTGGKSGAGTFFVKPEFQATRFIKIASWLEIQTEYLAYKQVIQPRLNSYTANLVSSPVFSADDPQVMPLGAIAYSLAGFPEDYGGLSDFDDLMLKYLPMPDGAKFLGDRLIGTLEKVIYPLHGYGKTIKPNQRKSLWRWLYHDLPPLTGQLVALADLDPNDWQTAPKLDLNLAPESSETRYRLVGWLLDEVNCSDKQGEIIVSHPQQRVRLRLRGDRDDILQRFRAVWIRLGMPVEIVICLDRDNQSIAKFIENISPVKSRSNPQTANCEISKLTKFAHLIGVETLPNPLDCLVNFTSESFIPFDYEITAHQGAIHGDLNLHNILFSSESDRVGWLIDFARSQSEGMVAFDFAKLIVTICNEHLAPAIYKLAESLRCIGQESPITLLWYLALRSLDLGAQGEELFATQIHCYPETKPASEVLLMPILNTLRVAIAVREFALHKCHLSTDELHWCLAVYFLNSSKFKNLRDRCPEAPLLAFLSSSWYLR